MIFSSTLYAKSKEKSKDKQNTDSTYSEENDMSLWEIDRLIRKTEYGEALRQLNIYINNKPDNFDNAQRRIKRIMNIRKEYSILAEKLITLIQEEPDNDKKIYEITAQLERFERHPSDENLKFIADLKKSAEFNYFRSKYNEVLTTSAQLTQSGQYPEAIAYVKNEGFWLYQEDFYQKWEDNEEITNEVNQVVSHLDTQIALFNERNFNNRLNRAVNEYVAALNADRYEEASKLFNTVDTTFRDYAKIRNSIFDDAEQLRKLFDKIKKIDEDTTDASYLPFLYRFIFGVESIPGSGIVGAVDGQWNALVGKMNTAAFGDVLNYYNAYTNIVTGKEAATGDKIAQTAAPYKAITNYTGLEQKTLNLYKYLKEAEGRAVKNPYSSYFTTTDYVSALALNTTEAYRIEDRLNAIKLSADANIAGIQTERDSKQKASLAKNLFDFCATISSVTGEKDKKLLAKADWAAAYSHSDVDKKQFEALEINYSHQINLIFDNASQILKGVWQQLTVYYDKCADEMVEQINSYNDLSKKYGQGFNAKIDADTQKRISKDVTVALNYKLPEEKDDGKQILLRYKYPDIALSVASYAQKQVDRAIETINSYEAVVNTNYNSHAQYKTEEDITKLVEDCNKYLEEQKAKLAVLKSESGGLVAQAQSQITQAQLARNEGDMRYNEAETSLKRDNFGQARRKLQDALSKYEEALSVANDENLRSQWDKKLQDLNEKINRTENEIIVKEVRNLKNEARDAYFNGRFDDAEKYLNQAKIRWAVTNAQEDEEITSLMNFVNTAISMQTGREILPSAPQYPEMSQLINIANQYFDSGAKKYKDGNKADGDKDLEKALESIQKVQYVYPLNQEASILTLKINQIKDPAKFNEEFAQKIQNARAMCKNTNTVQEGYSNLLDYYKLNPDYKGLKDLIYQVEIDIGIRQKPVDNSAQTRSKNLYNDAQKAYNNAGNNIVKLQASLEKVNRALALNPNNTQAQNLKDKIITKMGGTSVQPTMEDESLYNQAIQYLQNNNVIAANQILQQLMNKPQNQYVQKFKDLKAKIDARM